MKWATISLQVAFSMKSPEVDWSRCFKKFLFVLEQKVQDLNWEWENKYALISSFCANVYI